MFSVFAPCLLCLCLPFSVSYSCLCISCLFVCFYVVCPSVDLLVRDFVYMFMFVWLFICLFRSVSVFVVSWREGSMSTFFFLFYHYYVYAKF